MKLSDLSTGPDWLVWVFFVLFLAMSVTLLTGHGSWLISGYNTASKKEKAKYNEKKLCRVTGAGMAVITLLILVMEIFEDVLPADFVAVAVGIIFIDCLAMILIGNIFCRR